MAASVITGCIGGVIRDITAGVPFILMRHELYVTAALIAAASFVALAGAGVAAPLPALIGFGLGFVAQGAAIRWNITLPASRALRRKKRASR